MLTLSFIFFATRGNFSFLMDQVSTSAPGGALADPSNARHLGVVGYVLLPGIAYSIVMWLLVTNFRAILELAWQRKALTVLAVLSLASAAWSQSPGRTLYAAMFYLLGTLLAYYLVLRFSAEEIMGLIKMTGVAVCVLGAVMVAVFPAHGTVTMSLRDSGAWLGIFPDRVSAAKCIVYLLSPAIVLAFGRSRSPWRNALYVLLLLLFVVEAKAVSALGVLAGFSGIMGVLYLLRRLERRTAIFLGTVLASACIVFVLVGLPLLAALLGIFGRDMTLTGRTEIWAILMPSIMKQPLLGYGYYAFWQGMTGESANVILAAHWFFGYAHNGMLEIVLQLGVVGLALFLVTFFKACKDAWFCMKHGRSVGVEWYCSLLVLTVLYNVDEETVLWPNDLLSILYIVTCCGLAVEARRIRSLKISESAPVEDHVEVWAA